MDTTCIGLKATVVEVLPAGGSQIWQVNGYETPVLGTPSGSIPLAFGSSSYVSLIYTDVFGCIDTVAQTYTVGTYTDAVKFSIPNVFTPNGDGLNDRFNLISNAEIGECLTMRIFDRWGNVAYESTTGSVGWNGNHESGGQAAIGVYYYILSVRDEEFHGYLTLLR